MIKGFREFIMRGNVVDLAVAVIIGTAFGTVVTAFSEDFIGGILGSIGGSPDFGTIGPTINKSRWIIGTTITALINFLIIAAAVYFIVVIPMKKLTERRMDAAEEDEAAEAQIVLLTEIRDLLARR